MGKEKGGTSSRRLIPSALQRLNKSLATSNNNEKARSSQKDFPQPALVTLVISRRSTSDYLRLTAT